MSRIYEIPVLLNKLFPGVMDGISSMWVWQRRKNEIPLIEQIRPVKYQGASPVKPLLVTAGAIGVMALLIQFAKRNRR